MRYTLDEIETFLAAMELGSVTAASARLNFSKSVISKRIADLERALGAALFLTGPRSATEARGRAGWSGPRRKQPRSRGSRLS